MRGRARLMRQFPLSFESFCFLPNQIHFFKRGLIETLVGLLQFGFDVMKAAREPVDGLSQDFFGFDVEKARQIDQGKKQIA